MLFSTNYGIAGLIRDGWLIRDGLLVRDWWLSRDGLLNNMFGFSRCFISSKLQNFKPKENNAKKGSGV